MNIHDATRLERVLQRQDLPPAHPRKVKDNESAQIDLSGARALNEGLERQPEVRASKLERIRNILSTTHYPPEELIRGISRLIAEHHRNPESAQ